MKKYLDLAIANELIKTTDIKGKEYAEVNQRIKAFRSVYPQGTINTTMLSNENGVCVFKAQVISEDGTLLATGTAYEREDSSFINKTSYIENCETSAIGRALGIAGFGIDVSVASAEEVQNAIQNQEPTKEEAEEYTLTFGKYKGLKLKEVPSNYIEWLLSNSEDKRLHKLIELELGIVLPSEEEQVKKLKLLAELNEKIINDELDRDDVLDNYGKTKTKDLTIEELEAILDVSGIK